MAFTEVNGAKLWYEVTGEGDPVMHIHGAGFGHFNFATATPIRFPRRSKIGPPLFPLFIFEVIRKVPGLSCSPLSLLTIPSVKEGCRQPIMPAKGKPIITAERPVLGSIILANGMA